MIDVQGLGKTYGRLAALEGVSLAVRAGEAVAILGPNGSGKTTLLRLLATLTRPTAGAGRIAGHDLVRERDRVRALVGYLGHGTQHYDDLTARENLEVGATLAGLRLDPGAADAALARAG